MRAIRFFQRTLILLFVLVTLAIGYTAYVAIGNIVAEQSRIQQESLSPVFSLIVDELMKPLHLAQAVAQGEQFHQLMNTSEVDETKMAHLLTRMEKQFGLVFFAASEKARKQFMSNGRILDLVEGQVFWYFEALAQDKDIIADLGQVGNVHLYFDIKVYNADNELLGIVGVGKSLKEFLSQFSTFKQRYGYDFLFVNEDDQIILSSDPKLATSNEKIPNLAELDWYTAMDSLQRESLNSQLIQKDNKEYLISEVTIQELDWHLLLLIPLEARQAEINKTFISNAVLLIGSLFALVAIIYPILLYIKRDIQRTIDKDELTGLVNRKHIHRVFTQLAKPGETMSLIMVDVDHFKNINDSHGHNTGDMVLKSVTQVLAKHIRKQDVLGRWGGEEFIILLPNTNAKQAEQIAERARQELADSPVNIGQLTLPVTASFGVSEGNGDQELINLVAVADQALYKAKEAGRNRIQIIA